MDLSHVPFLFCFMSGWFVTEGEASDCAGCCGGDPFPAQSGPFAPRHQAQKCSGRCERERVIKLTSPLVLLHFKAFGCPN